MLWNNIFWVHLCSHNDFELCNLVTEQRQRNKKLDYYVWIVPSRNGNFLYVSVHGGNIRRKWSAVLSRGNFHLISKYLSNVCKQKIMLGTFYQSSLRMVLNSERRKKDERMDCYNN